jgi:hypothetical protein
LRFIWRKNGGGLWRAGQNSIGVSPKSVRHGRCDRAEIARNLFRKLNRLKLLGYGGETFNVAKEYRDETLLHAGCHRLTGFDQVAYNSNGREQAHFSRRPMLSGRVSNGAPSFPKMSPTRLSRDAARLGLLGRGFDMARPFWVPKSRIEPTGIRLDGSVI